MPDVGEVLGQDLQDVLQARVAGAVEKTGISKRLQSELRFRLIESLHREGLASGDGDAVDGRNEVLLSSAPPALRDHALFSLVLDFLRAREKHYALSVLLPECSMSTSDVYSYEEVGQVLALNRVPLFASCFNC